jgi:hypothetical protein
MTDNGFDTHPPGANSFGETIAVLAQSVDLMSEELTRVRADLRGNGKPGVLTTMALLDRRVEQLESFESEVIGARRWAAVGALGLLGNLTWIVVNHFLEAH